MKGVGRCALLDFVWEKAILVSKITHHSTLTAASAITLTIHWRYYCNLAFRVHKIIGYAMV